MVVMGVFFSGWAMPSSSSTPAAHDVGGDIKWLREWEFSGWRAG